MIRHAALRQHDSHLGFHVFRLFGPPSLFAPFMEIALVIAATVPNTRRCGTVQGRRPFGCGAGAGSGGLAGSFSMEGIIVMSASRRQGCSLDFSKGGLYNQVFQPVNVLPSCGSGGTGRRASLRS